MALRILAGFAFLTLLAGCATNSAYTPLLRAEPAIDSVQSRAPRTLRLYFDALPNVDVSNLVLRGPAGDYNLRGLHTMAADDLMIEILDPLTEGDYVVEWVTRVGEDPVLHQGSFGFKVDLQDN